MRHFNRQGKKAIFYYNDDDLLDGGFWGTRETFFISWAFARVYGFRRAGCAFDFDLNMLHSNYTCFCSESEAALLLK